MSNLIIHSALGDDGQYVLIEVFACCDSTNADIESGVFQFDPSTGGLLFTNAIGSNIAVARCGACGVDAIADTSG